MLGAFFFIRQKYLVRAFHPLFYYRYAIAASDWTYCNFSVRRTNEDFWARTNNLKINKVQVAQKRRWIYPA